MGCSASSASVLPHGDPQTGTAKQRLSDSTTASNSTISTSKQKGNKNKEKKLSQISATKHIKLSTKTPKEFIPPERRAEAARTRELGGHVAPSGSSSKQKSNEVPYSSDEQATTSNQNRNSVISKKRKADKIEDDASVDVPCSTRTPKERLPPLNKGKSPIPEISSSSTPSPLTKKKIPNISPAASTEKKDDIDSTQPIVTSQVDSSVVSSTKLVKAASTSTEEINFIDLSKDIGVSPLNNLKEVEDKKSSNIKDNNQISVSHNNIETSAMSELPRVEEGHRLKKPQSLKLDLGEAQNTSSSLLSSGREHTSSDMSSHTSVRSSKTSKHCSGKEPKEKKLKIKSKDEKTQFVVKAVKSDRGHLHSRCGDHDESTNSILIQTDLISVDDNNEKTKRKLLIKMKKLGSKSEPKLSRQNKQDHHHHLPTQKHNRTLKKDAHHRIKEVEDEKDGGNGDRGEDDNKMTSEDNEQGRWTIL